VAFEVPWEKLNQEGPHLSGIPAWEKIETRRRLKSKTLTKLGPYGISSELEILETEKKKDLWENVPKKPRPRVPRLVRK